MRKKRKYDSKFEERLHKGVLKNTDYHPDKVSYEVPARMANYTPDFKWKHYIIESKGRFRPGEYKKYLHIKKQCDKMGLELIFLFQDPNCKMPGAKKRKDGTFNLMKDWADKNNIKWYTEQTIKEIL